MIYRVNLYQERGARASRIRRSLLRGAVLGVLIGLEILLIGFLAISGVQIREKAAQVDALRAGVDTSVHASPDANRARIAEELIRVRVNRVDWSPMLEAAAGAIPPELVLTRITAESGTGRQRELTLEGRFRGSSSELDPVIRYMAALRDSAVITRTFPLVQLGTSQGERGSFQVVCREEEKKQEPEEGK